MVLSNVAGDEKKTSVITLSGRREYHQHRPPANTVTIASTAGFHVPSQSYFGMVILVTVSPVGPLEPVRGLCWLMGLLLALRSGTVDLACATTEPATRYPCRSAGTPPSRVRRDDCNTSRVARSCAVSNHNVSPGLRSRRRESGHRLSRVWPHAHQPKKHPAAPRSQRRA